MTSLARERDLIVPMRGGVHLFANLFRPTVDGRYLVIMSVTPYGKDKLPDRLAAFFMRLSGVKFGNVNCSRLTGFEAIARWN
jgi:predicted acyl esterase